MSDTSRSRIAAAQPTSYPPAAESPMPPLSTASTARSVTHRADPGSLVRDTLPLLRDWLPRQRWFSGKGHPITALTPASVTLLPSSPGPRPDEPLLLHLLLTVEQRSPSGATSTDRYQLLLGARPQAPVAHDANGNHPNAGTPNGGTPNGGDPLDRAPSDRDPERMRAAVIGRISGGPHDGLLTYDAAYDPALTRRLLRFLADGGPQGSRLGALRFSTLRFNNLYGPALADLATPGVSAQVGTAEQSNTSVIYGDAAILKLFRRISPGLNPDLELSLALGRAGSSHVPTPLAWFEADLPDLPDTAPPEDHRADAAATRRAQSQPRPQQPQPEPATLGLLQRYLHGAKDGWEFALTHVRRLRTDPEWQSTRNGRPSDHITGNFSAESFLLGRATAEVHLALARTLPVAVLDQRESEALADAMALRLDAAVLAVPALAPYRAPLRRIFRDLAEAARDGRVLRAQRIHGDLHLGQAMRTQQGWVLLDFEGEPAKPLEERRRPQPAVRDVAAMLRSFDYAAAHLLAEVAPAEPTRPRLAALAATWALRNRAAFCAGYAASGAADPAADPVLLHALETDKAIYEVVYEARNRPDWLPIPMSAIARLAEAASP
ncbi:maltokinase [Streptacidiphilus sp. EB129]|uniref:maltokinase N-terminal cap-like domain-containing protein n=1 Tax=Streptacidiphilus sp. EB129 TaxID=3156262 RepID=UPI003519BE43